MKKIILILFLCLFLFGCQQNQLDSSPKVNIEQPVITQVQEPVTNQVKEVPKEVVCTACQKKVGNECIDYECCTNSDCDDNNPYTRDYCGGDIKICSHVNIIKQNIKLVSMYLLNDTIYLKVCKDFPSSIDGQRSFIFEGEKTYVQILNPISKLKLCGKGLYTIGIPIMLIYDSTYVGEEILVKARLDVSDSFNMNKSDDLLVSNFKVKVKLPINIIHTNSNNVVNECYENFDCYDDDPTTLDICESKSTGNICKNTYDDSSTSKAECNTDSDCEVSGKAYYCDDGECRTFENTKVDVGDINGFCNAYIGCSQFTTTISYSGITKEISIEGPGYFIEKACTLKLTYEDSSITSGSAGLIANSYDSCINNVPHYFFNSLVKNFCCRY